MIQPCSQYVTAFLFTASTDCAVPNFCSNSKNRRMKSDIGFGCSFSEHTRSKSILVKTTTTQTAINDENNITNLHYRLSQSHICSMSFYAVQTVVAIQRLVSHYNEQICLLQSTTNAIQCELNLSMFPVYHCIKHLPTQYEIKRRYTNDCEDCKSSG